MKIGRTVIHDFGPFTDAEVDLSKPGLTLLEGSIAEFPGCDSNGAGKSMVLEAITWCLWGKFLREDLTAENVVRRNTKSCYVTVDITGLDYPTRIERYRNHPKYKNIVRVIVGDEDITRGRDKMSQAVIEQLLGMDYRTYTNTIAFGARDDVKSFFLANDRERKEILDRLLGLQDFARAHAHVKSKITKLRTNTNHLDADCARLEERLAVYVEELEACPSLDDIAATRAAAKVAYLDASKYTDTWANVKAEIETCEQDLHGLTAETTKAEAKYEIHKRAAQQKVNSARDDLDRARNKNARAIAALESIKSRLSQLQERAKDKGAAVCGECGRPMDKSHQAHARKGVADQIITVTNEQDEAQKQVTATKRAQEIAKQAQDEAQKALDGVPLPPAAPKKAATLASRLATLRAEESELRATYDDAKDQMDEALAEADQDERQLREYQQRVTDTEGKIKVVREQQDEAKAEVAELEFWRDAFGDAGIKSFVIESVLADVNKTATMIASRLLREGTVIKVSATRRLKTSDEMREEMSVEAKIPGVAQTYGGASKGQRLRLDLSILLALREIAATRATKPISQLFADEVFDGLDRSGCEAVVEVLRDLSGEQCPILLVSHDPRVKRMVDRVILVVHNGTTADVQTKKAQGARG